MNYLHKIAIAIGLATLCMLILPASTFAQASSQQIPYSNSVFVPCANGGAGETIELEGTLHIVFNDVVDGNGCHHLTFHANPMGVTATGQTTGDTYRAVGNSVQSYSDYTVCGDECEIVIKTVSNFNMVGPGPGNNYMQHTVSEFSFNICTFEFTPISNKSTITCK